MNIYPSYTYHISWTKQDKHYYGVRVANQCQPEEDLWIEYHTSSNIVKSFREEYGEPDIIRIDKTFDTREAAGEYEIRFLTENGCVMSSKWLNMAAWPLIDSRGKNNGMYGKTHSEEAKRKQAEASKGENHPMYGKTRSEETRKKHSESIKGENNGMYGKTHSEEAKRKISESKKGKPQEKVTCPHCKKVGGITVMKRWHFDNCKKKSIIITRIM